MFNYLRIWDFILMGHKYGLTVFDEKESLRLKRFDSYISDNELKSVMTQSLPNLAEKGMLANGFDEVYNELNQFLINIENGKNITPRQYGLVSYFIQYTLFNGKAPDGFYYKRKKGERKNTHVYMNRLLTRTVKALNLGGISLENAFYFVGEIHQKSEDSVRKIYERTKDYYKEKIIPDYEIEAWVATYKKNNPIK